MCVSANEEGNMSCGSGPGEDGARTMTNGKQSLITVMTYEFVAEPRVSIFTTNMLSGNQGGEGNKCMRAHALPCTEHTHACMNAHMHACTRACMRARKHARTHACTHTCIHVRMRVDNHAHAHANKHAHMHTRLRTHAHTRVCTYAREAVEFMAPL